MKRLPFVALCFVLVAVLVTGCGAPKEESATADDVLKVALAADTGGINDKAINEDRCV